MQTCDVLIVGGGIAGASAAYEIAPFAKVILLERESQPGYHTTGRSAAVFAPAYGNRVIRALTAASHAFYRERAAALAGRDAGRTVRGGGASRCRRGMGGPARRDGRRGAAWSGAEAAHGDPVRTFDRPRPGVAGGDRCRRGVLFQAGIRPAPG